MLEAYEGFIREVCNHKILEAVREGKTSVIINYNDLDIYDPQLAGLLLDAPNRFFFDINEAMKEMDFGTDKTPEITFRFENIPDDRKSRIKDIRSKDIGKIVKVEGTVKRGSTVIPEVKVALFECTDCGESIEVFQIDKVMTYPDGCQCGKKKGFKLIDRHLHDTRYIVVEDPFESVSGEEPGRITVFLKDDMTTPKMQRKTDPGSRLEITGILREMPKKIGNLKSKQIDIFIECNHFTETEIQFEDLIITDEDKQKIKELSRDPKIYERLVRSLAPSMFGMDEIKEAILLQLFGGVPQVLPDGTKIRGDIHVLLIGDPSAGKTQLLKLVSEIVPRGRYVSGKGSSAAGLTATVVKDEEFMGGWVLEAGAIVLSNKSTICIDEFDKMSQEDMINLHEAMSTQTISISKATIQATLPARTSILAGANPKYLRFDRLRSISEQINIPDTILSRFDLKFILYDIADKERDEMLVDHVIRSRLDGDSVKPDLDADIVRKYIAFAKSECRPKMTKDAANLFKAFFVDLRSKHSNQDSIPITLRQYEALMRMAEASAKIRFSDVVEEQDAKRAVKLMSYTISKLGLDPDTGEYDIDRAEGGVTASQRSKVRVIADTIEEIIKEQGEPFNEIDLYASLEEKGITETAARPTILKMKQGGELFEPRPGKLQKA